MKRLRSVFLIASLLVPLGCSGGGAGPGTPPSIYNLVYFPREFRVGAGGGAVGVQLLFNFKDPDGDVERYRLSTPEGTLESPLQPSVDGVEGGIAVVPVLVSTATAGRKAYAIALVDSEGNVSNLLSFAVTIR